MSRSVKWGELRRPQFEEAVREKAVVVIPVGAIEQHGRHLPVDTDNNIVTEIALRAAASLERPWVLVTPTVPFGLSPHHMGFPGTITLGFQTLADVACDVCRGVHHHGFRKIVLLNGHGGNTALLNAVTVRLVEERIYVASLTYWTPIAGRLKELGRSPLGGMSHACEMETSLQLHLRPHLVDLAAVVDEPIVPETSFFNRDFRAPGSVTYPLDMKIDSREGVRGSPSYAAPETGERILEAAAAQLAEFLVEFAAAPER